MSAPTTNIPVSVPAGQRSPAPSGGRGGPGTGPATIAGSLSGIPDARSVVTRLLHGTPGRMRVLGLVAVVAALVVGAVSVSALLGAQAAVDRAATNTAQVVRAQTMHVELLRADALATNAFLVGGLESPQSRAQYEAAMSAVARGISEAAAAQPADAEALGALSAQVQQYAALVEQARTNNRQLLPVGAQYLRQASAGLRAEAIPTVEAVVTANEKRSSAEFSHSSSVVLLVLGALALAVLVYVAVWLARRTHRYLNRSLTGAVALLLVVLVAAAVTVGNISRDAQAVDRGSFTQVKALADVRTAAYDARAQEGLGLVARGQSGDSEKAFTADVREVTDAINDVTPRQTRQSLGEQWSAYTTKHGEIRAADDSGDWEQAVGLATSTGSGSATATFTTFDTTASNLREDASREVAASLDGIGGRAPWIALALGAAALAAAWLVLRGFAQRLQEYR
jgi:hypothetical protein